MTGRIRVFLTDVNRVLPTNEPTSWSVVLRGLVQGLEACDRTSLLHISYGTEDERDMTDHDVEIAVGNPIQWTPGRALRRYIMVAPNASRLPEQVTQALVSKLTPSASDAPFRGCILTPSSFAEQAIARSIDEEQAQPIVTLVVPHGIQTGMRKAAPGPVGLGLWDGKRPISLLHIASSQSERKGTDAFLTALTKFTRADVCHADGSPSIMVAVVCTVPGIASQYADKHAYLSEVGALTIVDSSVARHPHEQSYARYLRCDAVIHPSAYEGFGLVPLEALSVGTPCFVSPIERSYSYPGLHCMIPADACVTTAAPSTVGGHKGTWVRYSQASLLKFFDTLVSTDLLARMQTDALASAQAVQQEWSWMRKTRSLFLDIVG